MKEILLNKGYKTFVDDEDFEYLNQFNWFVLEKGKNLYAASAGLIKNKPTRVVYLHRTVLNASPKEIIDPIDNNGLNNCKYNLRLATKSQNAQNVKGVSKRNTSGYIGVHFHSKTNKYAAEICKNYTKKYLGLFSLAIDAAKARDLAAIEIHGEFAKLNFPIETYEQTLETRV